MSLLVVGSIGIDDVKTPREARKDLLGGSASYAAVAASYFAEPRLVGVVGEDFPGELRRIFQRRGVDLAGMQVEPGRTFRWSGEYFHNMNERRTLSVALNVFERFRPDLPPSCREASYALLGNIAPSLQTHVLGQMRRPRFTMADTMDLWIRTARDDLLRLLKKVDAICMNDSEARELTGEPNLNRAGRALLRLGPSWAIVKKGEHGSLLFGKDAFFSTPAFPVEDVQDPTGAGDAFAGGFMGSVARQRRTDFATLQRAAAFGSVMAAFTVESFSLDRLCDLSSGDIKARWRAFARMGDYDRRDAGAIRRAR
ncbi:MAG: sugar kinase [Verrucomicrobiae bacterium]|nr:sugar kinase [Verrucomicrobiae bacterium]